MADDQVKRDESTPENRAFWDKIREAASRAPRHKRESYSEQRHASSQASGAASEGSQRGR